MAKYKQYEPVLSISAHNAAISALAVHENLLVTGSSDSLVKIWKIRVVDDVGTRLVLCLIQIINIYLDKLEEVQTIALEGKYAVSLALATLPQSKGNLSRFYSHIKFPLTRDTSALILAVGGTTRDIQIFTRSEDNAGLYKHSSCAYPNPQLTVRAVSGSVGPRRLGEGPSFSGIHYT